MIFINEKTGRKENGEVKKMSNDLEIFITNDRRIVKVVEYIRNKAGIIYKGKVIVYECREQSDVFGRQAILNENEKLCKEELLFRIQQKDE